MRLLLYAVLLVLIFAVSTTIEEARAPLAQTEPDGGTLPESPPNIGVEGEGAVGEPPPLIGAQEPVVSSEPGIEYTEEYVVQLETALHEKVNVERVREGLSVLGYDEELAKIAASHSTDMARENYFAHEDEDGCTSACRLDRAGYEWRLVGENLFLLRGSYRYSVEDAAAIIVAGWLGSAGHRKNLLNKSFTKEGMGVVVEEDSLYATELLARPR